MHLMVLIQQVQLSFKQKIYFHFYISKKKANELIESKQYCLNNYISFHIWLYKYIKRPSSKCLSVRKEFFPTIEPLITHR